jgi:hypothetical protein
MICFNQSNNNINNDYESIFLNINPKNNKLRLFYTKNNIKYKISINKKLNPETKKGKFILNFLGYSNEPNVQYILECKFYKSNNLFYNILNMKYYKILLIIIGHTEPTILYKYNIENNFYRYNNTFITPFF